MWSKIEDESTIGTQGCEGGVIIKDEEHSFGARITLEQGGDIAPFAIIVGVYGSFFHTAYMDTQEEGEAMFKSMQADISEYFEDSEKTESNWVESFVDRY